MLACTQRITQRIGKASHDDLGYLRLVSYERAHRVQGVEEKMGVELRFQQPQLSLLQRPCQL